MADTSAVKAAAGALSTRCARTLAETLDLTVAKYTLAAMLCALHPQAEVPADANGGAMTPSDIAAIKELLSSALGAAGSRQGLARAVMSHYSHWATVVLDVGMLNWRHALMTAEAEVLFDGHFMCVPPREALEALLAALSSTAEAESVEQGDGPVGTSFTSGISGGRTAAQRRTACCVALLKALLHKGRIARLLEEHCSERAGAGGAAAWEADNESLVALVVSVPVRVSNALRRAPPSALAPGAFYRSLIEILLKVMAKRAGSSSERAQSVCGTLLARIGRQGCFRDVLPLLLGRRDGGDEGCTKQKPRGKPQAKTAATGAGVTWCWPCRREARSRSWKQPCDSQQTVAQAPRSCAPCLPLSSRHPQPLGWSTRIGCTCCACCRSPRCPS